MGEGLAFEPISSIATWRQSDNGTIGYHRNELPHVPFGPILSMFVIFANASHK